jgi:hypothetical protein
MAGIFEEFAVLVLADLLAPLFNYATHESPFIPDRPAAPIQKA